LIAHRGGVIAPEAPENSLAAIHLASQRDYDMVELDVVDAKDRVPMLFHAFRGSGNLYVDCGFNQSLGEFTSDELSRITYRLSTQTIARLSEALELCAQLGMGVMLDIKVPDPFDAFLDSVTESLLKYGLDTCTLTLSTSQKVVEKFKDLVIYPLRKEE
jgi:glycerophosphoryl diester phosphodiesterase